MKRNKNELQETRQYKRAIESDLCHIQFDLRLGVKYGFNVTENLVYQIIKRFTQLKYGGYTGSVQTLQVFLNTSYNPIANALKTLKDRKFIDKKEVDGRECYVDLFVSENYYAQREEYIKKLKTKPEGISDKFVELQIERLKSQRAKNSYSTTHFENERAYTQKEYDKLYEVFENLIID